MSAPATSGFGSPGDHGPPGAHPGTTIALLSREALHHPSDMHAYSATIAATLNIAADRARLVVGYLRCEYRTLDSLSSQQIRADYREWIAATIDADPARADQLAASYGF